MRLVLQEAEKVAILITVASNLSEFNSDISFYFTNDGLRIHGTDSSHICLFDCFLENKWFNQYDTDNLELSEKADQDNPIKITLTIDIFYKILKMYKESQKLQIEYEIDSDYLKVSLTDGATSCDKYFDIPLLNTDDSINDLDMGESQVDLTMSSKKYTELISQFEMFNATINFKLSEDKINLYTNSCNGNMNIELDISNIDLDEDVDEKLGLVGYAIDEDLVLQQIFSVRYMKLISKFDKLSNDIQLSFIQDRPVVVEYSIQNSSYMKFYLAPRDDLE